MLPNPDIQSLRTHNTDLYILGRGTVMIFDLLLNCEILKQQDFSKSTAKDIIQSEVFTVNGSDYLITVENGQKVATLWAIDRTRKTVKCE